MYKFNSVNQGDDARYINELCDRAETALEQGLLPVELLCDDKLFRAEMERIFTNTWIFLAHDSEIPNNGDFVLRRMGLDQVIVARDNSGVVNVMLNHCRHRGSELCHEDQGNASHFKCPYHGWVYKNNGDWVTAPHLQDAYGGRLDEKQWGLLKAPKVESFHGFIFASLSEEVPSLRDYLGDAAWMLDAVFGLHPDGLKAIAPPERFRVKADWKSGAENFCGDAYHVSTAHLSAQLTEFMQGVSQVSTLAVGYLFENGHSFIGHRLSSAMGPAGELWGYPQEMRDKFQLDHLDEVQLEMITHRPPTIGTIFPNFSFLRVPQPAAPGGRAVPFTNIRMWQPIAPGLMEIWTWEFEFACASDEFRDEAYQSGQFGFGSGGIFEQDDTAVWEGIGKAANSPWNRKNGTLLHYNQKRCEPDPQWQGPGRFFPNIYGERLQQEFWRRYIKDLRDNAGKTQHNATMGGSPCSR